MNGAGLPVDRKGNVITPEQWTFKPTLYAAGAEFIRDLMQVDDRYEAAEAFWKMMGEPKGTVVVKCTLFKRKGSPFYPNHLDGDTLAEGYGAETCGQWSDPNKTMKMAAKKAIVHAAINLAAIRDLFAQDGALTQPRRDDAAPKVAPRAERQAAEKAGGEKPMGLRLNDLYAKWKAKRYPGDIRKSVEMMPLFIEWAKSILKTDKDFSSPSNWSIDALDACNQDLI